MAENLTRAAVDDGDEYAPAVFAAVEQGEVGGPALVGGGGDGAGDFDPWAVASTAFGKGPAFEFHDAVDLFEVHGNHVLVA